MCMRGNTNSHIARERRCIGGGGLGVGFGGKSYLKEKVKESTDWNSNVDISSSIKYLRKNFKN